MNRAQTTMVTPSQSNSEFYLQQYENLKPPVPQYFKKK